MAGEGIAVDVGRHNFDEIVVKGSTAKPVLVDFWAPWCAPCRTLAPILDKLAAEFAGRFTLAKLNTDAEPELAARYGIRGIPNVKAFVGGRAVDEFTGVLPEAAVREFLNALVPSPVAPLVIDAQSLLARGDAIGALAKLDAAFALDPDDEAALLARAEALLSLDRRDHAGAVLAELESPKRAPSRPVKDARRLAALKARVALGAPAAGNLDGLAAAAGKSPVDGAAKLAYANALAANGDYERALVELLAIVEADREFRDDIGRRTMLTIFDALGSDNELVGRYRRLLATAINR